MYIKMFGTTIPQQLTTWAYLLPKSSGNSVYERIGYKRGRLGRSSKELQGYCVWDNRVCEREREREMIGRNCFVQKSFCAKKKNFIAQFIDFVFLLLRLRVPLDVSNNIVSERERERERGQKIVPIKKELLPSWRDQLWKFKVSAQNTHQWGKYHSTTGLQFYKFGFSCFTTNKKQQFFWSSPVLLNWKPAV